MGKKEKKAGAKKQGKKEKKAGAKKQGKKEGKAGAKKQGKKKGKAGAKKQGKKTPAPGFNNHMNQGQTANKQGNTSPSLGYVVAPKHAHWHLTDSGSSYHQGHNPDH